MEILVGLLGAAIGLLIFLGGVFIGYKLADKTIKPIKTEPVEQNKEQEELEALIQEQKAFTNLLNYNADVAYGKVSVEMDK